MGEENHRSLSILNPFIYQAGYVQDMAYMNSLVDGMKLAFTVGLTLAVVNGVTARFSKNNQTLDQIVSEKVTFGGSQ